MRSFKQHNSLYVLRFHGTLLFLVFFSLTHLHFSNISVLMLTNAPTCVPVQILQHLLFPGLPQLVHGLCWTSQGIPWLLPLHLRHPPQSLPETYTAFCLMIHMSSDYDDNWDCHCCSYMTLRLATATTDSNCSHNPRIICILKQSSSHVGDPILK